MGGKYKSNHNNGLPGPGSYHNSSQSLIQGNSNNVKFGTAKREGLKVNGKGSDVGPGAYEI